MNSNQFYDGKFKATETWNEIITSFRNSMSVGKHWRQFKRYNNCFTASQGISWLHQLLMNMSQFGSTVLREQALLLLRQFHRAHLFEEVLTSGVSRRNKESINYYEQDLEDDNKFYRFCASFEDPEKNKENILLSALLLQDKDQFSNNIHNNVATHHRDKFCDENISILPQSKFSLRENNSLFPSINIHEYNYNRGVNNVLLKAFSGYSIEEKKNYYERLQDKTNLVSSDESSNLIEFDDFLFKSNDNLHAFDFSKNQKLLSNDSKILMNKNSINYSMNSAKNNYKKEDKNVIPLKFLSNSYSQDFKPNFLKELYEKNINIEETNKIPSNQNNEKINLRANNKKVSSEKYFFRDKIEENKIENSTFPSILSRENKLSKEIFLMQRLEKELNVILTSSFSNKLSLPHNLSNTLDDIKSVTDNIIINFYRDLFLKCNVSESDTLLQYIDHNITNVIYNITQINKNGMPTNISKKAQFPVQVLNSMKSLVISSKNINNCQLSNLTDIDSYYLIIDYFKKQDPKKSLIENSNFLIMSRLFYLKNVQVQDSMDFNQFKLFSIQCLLFLTAPHKRRKLMILIRFLSKMADYQSFKLDVNLDNKFQIVNVFTKFIFNLNDCCYNKENRMNNHGYKTENNDHYYHCNNENNITDYFYNFENNISNIISNNLLIFLIDNYKEVFRIPQQLRNLITSSDLSPFYETN